MSNHYGQSIKYGVLDAPALFTGDNMSFSYRDNTTADDQENGGSDIAAIALHSRKGDLQFSGEVTSGTTDFLDLSAGAKIAVAAEIGGIDLTPGFILAYEAVEEWNLLRRKTASVRAFHYMDGESDDVGASAGTRTAFTPAAQNLDFLFPGNTLIYSTVGITHAAGLVHQLRITQQLTITDDEPAPNGKLLGAFASGYKRTLSLLLLAKPADAAIPAPKSVLTFSNAPTYAANYRVISAEPRMERKKGMMFSIEAVWIPAFAA
jgi:hypothetical protein